MGTTPELPLVCPCCRVPGPPGQGAQVRPQPRGDGLACPGCGTAYPVIDDVACLPPDVATFLASQGAALEPQDPPVDPSAGAGCCDQASFLDPASVAFREMVLLGQHAAAQFPESCHGIGLVSELAGNLATIRRLAALLRAHPMPSDAPFPGILDAGCGPGRMAMELSGDAPSGAVGLDLRARPLRLASRVAGERRAVVPFRMEGTRFAPLEVLGQACAGPVRFVQGDVLAPPFLAEAFPAVVAVSLLDTVPDPIVTLGQLDALLVPGGLLLLASPWQWEPAVTPPSQWWSTAGSTSAQTLRDALRGGHPVLPHLAYQILDEADGLPWALPGHRRLVYRYDLQVVLARKLYPPG